MDKKQNFHSRQGSSKSLLSESRKSSDLYGSSKQWPRNARRRENPNQTNSKADPQRIGKPGSAKTRPNVDKRPKPRGGYGSLPLSVSASSTGLAIDDTATDSGNREFEVELNSIYTPGSKKQNLSHLLNFHYGSREYEASNTSSVFNRGGNRNIKRHKYNKEQFLQANFQFVIKSGTNIPSNTSSPDTLVDWNLIEQINIQTTEEPQCPICLYPPIAAKLTRCGHAYCWPCILHYLALSDKSWRKCPICYDAVHIGDLKSTSIVQQSNFSVGNIITLQLMRRKQGSLFIEKVEIASQFEDSIPHLRDDFDKKLFSKFLLADPYEILSIIERERLELVAGDDINCPESIFMDQALDLLLERKAIVLKEMGKKNVKAVEELEVVNEIKIEDHVEEIAREASGEIGAVVEEVVKTVNIPLTSASNDIKYYYFYQSNDGQNIYLHALNVKILQAMYGSLEQSPSVIKAKILQKESHSMDEDLRKRLRYLQHLPLTCQFEVVEVQFESPLISTEILDKFKDEIILRHKTRMRRAREERKRERHINEINDRQMGKIIARSANIDITSSQQFPSCGFDDFLSGSSPSDPAITFTSDSINFPATSNTLLSSGPSFAKMLSSPKKELWPTLDSGSTLSTGTVGEISAMSWAKTTLSRNSDRSSESEILNDPNGDAAHYAKQNFGDFIAEALQQKKTIAQEKEAALNNGSGGNKKGKKNKKTLLFSTGMNFNGN